MSEAAKQRGEPDTRVKWRLWDHIGMISGTILGLIALAFLIVVALGGGAGGTGVIVVIVAGVALVYFGGRMHGLRSRS
jgi:O-antigen ligase